jgi:uncharacterized protein
MRILLILIALAVIVLLVKRMWLTPGAGGQRNKRLPGEMVQCSHCGVYLPEQEAIRDGKQFYCSQQHLDADRGEH